MIRNEEVVSNEQESLGPPRIWQAVIVSAIRDWVSGPLRHKRESEEYIFGAGTDFTLVCESAGMDAERLRAKFRRLQHASGMGAKA